VFDGCTSRLAATEPSRSAAQQLHTEMCAELFGVTLPYTGTGPGAARTPTWPWLPVLAGAALLVLGTAWLRSRRG
jgi:hypothetical protein